MASLGQIIFCSMVTLIILFSTIIILVLSLTFSKFITEVSSRDVFPVGNIGEDQLLSCFLDRHSNAETISSISVTWERTGTKGFVYHLKNGFPEFRNQNPDFQGRTQLFPDALTTGNASLLLKNVRKSDEGFYICTIDSSDGGGRVNMQLSTAAYSAPTFTFSNGILTAHASRWFPKPNVTWKDHSHKILQGRTNLSPNVAGIYSIVSTLQPINKSEIYTCQIENEQVKSVSIAEITGFDVTESSFFIFSTASALLASTYLLVINFILCIYCLT